MTALLKAFDLVPGWAYALALSAVLALLAVKGYQLNTERTAHQTTHAVFAAQVANAERAAREQSEKNRTTEQELRDAQEAHAQEIAALHVNRDRDRAAAGAVVVRVRDAARATAALAGQVCADSSTAQLREAAGAAARMLADLRERADERAGILAQFATDAHLAGRACEREYDRTREALKAN
jgi:Tfp pilus assembly protein PilE